MLTEEKKAAKKPHGLILDSRKTLTVSGVSHVDSFDESAVIAYTDYGELMIGGRELTIEKLSVETGELVLRGEIVSLVYGENKPAGSFFSRLFR